MQQQQQQQQGGSQFGLPPAEMGPFMLGVSGSERIQQLPANEAATPNSSRAPAGSATPSANFDELAPAVAGNFPEDESLAGGEEAERGDGGASGKRWPRQETLTLLKIRSEMDAAFRDATLKGPLWEEVSRKLAELGYRRSAKKCKEKFENVHKYYKRTKDGRAGRQDGKSYRFFAELEALHSTGATTPTAVSVPPVPSSAFMSDPPSSRPPSIAPAAPPTLATPTRVVLPEPPPVGSLTAAGISFSSSSTDSSSSEYDDEEAGGRKRKRRGVVPGGTSRKMMAYFDGLMKQVMERQEAMQQRFLEAIEKREQDRMIREEAWRRQETARISRDHELLSHERAVAASRDAAIISYLQKITSGLSTPATAATPISVAPQVQLSVPPPPAPPQRKAAATSDSEPPEAVASASAYDPVASSSRWPKAEVHALIDIRSELETEFQEAGPKGTLWGEISARMQRVGYNRSAKRCKEKWENINKYFKKVKGGKKKRTGNSKTCPYYDQLDAIYRSKLLGETSTSQQAQQQAAAEAERNEGKKVNGDNNGSAENFEASGESVDATVQTSNGGLPPSFFDMGLKKPEDIVKELMGEPQEQCKMEEYDDEACSDNNMEAFNNDDDDNEDDEVGKLQYEIQFQTQLSTGGGGGGGNASAATTTANSFFAMAQ